MIGNTGFNHVSSASSFRAEGFQFNTPSFFCLSDLFSNDVCCNLNDTLLPDASWFLGVVCQHADIRGKRSLTILKIISVMW